MSFYFGGSVMFAWVIRSSLFAILLSTGLAANAGPTLRFTTFNVEWYGLGGDLNGSPSDETRDPHLRDLLQNKIPASDVIAFQEIIDLKRLQANVLPKGWTCLTYEHADAKHQHVAICARPGLQLMHEPSDDNDVIDEVAVNERSRPALHLIVGDKAGRPITRVVGVHLKAMPNFATTRYFQAKVIGDYLLKVADPTLPVVILGDFNTYEVAETKKSEDDEIAISEIFARRLTNATEVKAKFESTYRTPSLSSHFDRIWIAGKVKQMEDPSVYFICNLNKSQTQAIKNYNKLISDHCPVSVALKFD